MNILEKYKTLKNSKKSKIQTPKTNKESFRTSESKIKLSVTRLAKKSLAVKCRLIKKS